MKTKKERKGRKREKKSGKEDTRYGSPLHSVMLITSGWQRRDEVESRNIRTTGISMSSQAVDTYRGRVLIFVRGFVNCPSV